MKEKLLKRMAVLVMAAAMVLAMNINVFAAVNTDTATLNNDKGIESTETTINIAKQIVFINGEDTTVREPNITYTYTIATTTPGTATVTDKDNMTTTVKAGPLTAVTGAATATTSTVAFADTNTSAASASGTATASKYAAFTFDATKFSAPGVYRYKITESTNVTKASVGIVENPTYAAVRYLDVYVKKNGNALQVYGYVLFEGSDNQSIKSASQSGDVSMKSKGYVNTATGTAAPADVDVYTTQNVYVEKATTGTMADPDNDFPIELTLSVPSSVTATPKIDVVLGGNGTVTDTASDTIGTYITFAASVKGTVDNGSSIYLKGIPAGGKVSLVETNNTADSYKVKAGTVAGGATLLAEATVAAGAKSGATTAQNLTAKAPIYITNTLDAISPTNVVVRFAPYMFILAAAAMLLLLKSRRNKEQD